MSWAKPCKERARRVGVSRVVKSGRHRRRCDVLLVSRLLDSAPSRSGDGRCGPAHSIVRGSSNRALHHRFTTLEIHGTHRTGAATAGTRNFILLLTATLHAAGTSIHERLWGIAVRHWLLRHVALLSVNVVASSTVRRCSVIAHDIVERARGLLNSGRRAISAMLGIVRLLGCSRPGCCASR